MSNLHRHPAPPDASTAGLLLSLVNALPNPSGPLGRRARTVAHHLATDGANRALERRAADLLADLLSATDCDLSGYSEEGLLSADFDL